ncbi:hypothetical protein [Owenweeksia hongkongensis]|uniref:hypothetical protein n=1 Tax=Owenweeksia hongkongensis TaxID=253245 RepID=UPI003A94B220
MNIPNLSIDPKAGQLSAILYSKEITSLQNLLDWLLGLPYGRNSDRTDYTLILKENKGTCSTKHALVRAVAIENNWPDVNLYIGFFFMDSNIYPRLKDILEKAGLEGIPEAHTFLVIDGNYVDVTSKSSPIEEGMIIDEMDIDPVGIGDLKESIHKGFIADWAEEEKINLPLNQIWATREACIKELSKA